MGGALFNSSPKLECLSLYLSDPLGNGYSRKFHNFFAFDGFFWFYLFLYNPASTLEHWIPSGSEAIVLSVLKYFLLCK